MSTVLDEFKRAVKQGELEKVKACITLGVDVNEFYDNGNPIFFIACKHPLVLELFLAHPNLNLNIKNDCGYTALIYSCCNYSSCLEAVRRLCQVPGIDLNSQDNEGDTAAYFAALKMEPDCVKILRTVPGINWNIKNHEGDSPITVAIDKGSLEILKILLTIPSIDFNVQDGNGRSIAQIAVESDESPFSPLLNPIDCIQCVEILSRDSRVNWNIRNSSGETPIMYTWRKRKTEMFRILMNVPTIDKNTFIQDTFNYNVGSNVTAPECPVCYERFSRNTNIFQCTQGHFVCQRCRERVETCPVCRGEMIGRAHDFEQFLQTLNI